MNAELKTVLEQLANLIERWNNKDIPNEEELLAETKKLAVAFNVALAKPNKEQAKIEQ